MASSTVRSNSVSAPRISKSICLPVCWAKSRTRPRQFAPGISDRLHAGFHHPFLQIGGHAIEVQDGSGINRLIVAADQLQQLIARQHQLADEVHQTIQDIHVHANR